MAILGSLRKNSVVLITVIGMALFAFVISGVFDGKGYVAQAPIGVINGEDLSIEEFRDQVDFLQTNYNVTGINAVNSVWDQKVRASILDDQFELSGVGSGKDHIESLISENPSFSSDPRFQNEIGGFDINKFIDFITDLKTTNTLAYEQWKNQELAFENQSNEKIYFDLIKSGINFSYKDAQIEYLSQNEKVDIEYIKIPFSSINDSLIKLKKSQIEKYIKENESEYKVDSSRNIKYVLFDENPSAEDETATRKILENLLNERKEFNSVSKLEEVVPSLTTTNNLSEFINDNSEIPFDSLYIPKGALPVNDANILFDLDIDQTYGPYKDGEYFKISRMLDRKVGGNVRASHILIAYQGSQNASPQTVRTKLEAQKEAKRILTLVRRNPNTFSSLASEFSDGPSSSVGGDLGFVQQGAMVKPFNDFIFSNRVGAIGMVETDFGFHVINVVAKEDLVLLASVAIKNLPSETTSDRVFNSATKFEIGLSKDLNFDDLADESDYDVKTVNSIKVLDENLPGLPNQRRLVQWLFSDETKVNSYKRFDLSSGGYIVALVTGLTNEGLATIDDVRFTAIPKIRNIEKAKLIIEENSDLKTLEDLASYNEITVNKALALNQKSATIADAGFEPLVVGHAFALPENEESDFIVGQNGVYKIRVIKKDSSMDLESYRAYKNQLIQSKRPTSTNSLYLALKENAEIEDNRSTYY
ncbi:MAG: peptidylprolyl isomerase [Flavobacteriaceae bacterium]|nr:peptidylprolyl isomerase [Flavobacteriaceae bacterium]